MCLALILVLALAGFTTPKKTRSTDQGRIKAVSSDEIDSTAKNAGSASVSSKDIAAAQKMRSYTKAEIEMITAVVMHEVGHCTRASKIAVTNVILNRVKAGQTVYEVLHAPGQFTAINNYYNPRIAITPLTREAVLAAIGGEDNSHGAIFYCNPSFTSQRNMRFFATRTYLFTLEGQNYYK